MDLDSDFFTFLGFKFQITFLRFIFQTAWDSGFKFEMGGILDSGFGLQGLIIIGYSIQDESEDITTMGKNTKETDWQKCWKEFKAIWAITWAVVSIKF